MTRCQSGLVAIAAASCCLPALAQTLLPPGALSTNGNQIIDRDGRAVRLACVGWNQVNKSIPLDQQTRLMAAHGFNCIRFSWVNATMQQDLRMIDSVVAAARSAGLRLVVDNHTNEPGHGDRDNWGAQQRNGLWFDQGEGSDGTDGGGNKGTTTNAKFLSDWQEVTRRYAGNQTIIGYDLRNEPLDYPGTSEWGTGSARDLRAMYTRVGDAVLAIDPDKLIVVEPTDTGWHALGKQPVMLRAPHKLVYSVHEYPTEISAQKIDSGPALVKRMNEVWGWVFNTELTPIFVGEMGASMASARSKAWAATIVPYLNGTGKDALHIPDGGQGASTDWWAWGYLPGQNPNGTLESDWKTPRPEQEAVYAKLRQRPLPTH